MAHLLDEGMLRHIVERFMSDDEAAIGRLARMCRVCAEGAEPPRGCGRF